MGKKENAEKERREEKKKSSKNHGSVIVTVYVESSSTADQKPHRKSKSSSKSNRQNHCFRSKPPISKRYGSDRKAQLLAYAQQLRSSHKKQIGWLETNLRTKRKWSSWGKSRSKCRLFFQKIFHPVRSREGYEPILSDKERSDYKSNSRSRNCSNNFCKRLRSMLKELSRGWKRNK
ncbi:uncharacterized protein LOC122075633 isoform X2 [Macadamia integrifolia]|uniref:uncharacterized protein LOC122075633 isoform X2 n=1 Tax=Macadamia integrifolia TaxID=60698 RepID=UPI001C4FE91E|nr:uncharacterized protein LOC122075633 isoform X2 [Macadamia integrifolia]